MTLTGSQFQQLQQALMSAFPDRASLAQMVRFGLDENLDAIATGNLNEVVFQLITWADARGRLMDLVTAAQRANPGNPQLAALSASSGGPVSTAPSTGGGVAIGGSANGSVIVTGSNNTVHTSPVSSSPSVSAAGHSPFELFYSYSHKDERLREKLETHLALLRRQGVIAGWHDRKIGAGQEWADQIDEHLNSARIILLLVSAEFLASDYCYDIELKRAMERHEAGEARVIPIILRSCDWHASPFGKLKALPKDGKPITDWPNRDTALLDVAQGIRRAVEALPPAL